MRLLFLLGITIQIRFILTSLITICQSSDHELIRAYHRYLVNPSYQNFSIFGNYVNAYYNQSPLQCLKLLKQFHNDYTFKMMFMRALNSSSPITNQINNNVILQIKFMQGIVAYIERMFTHRFIDEATINSKLEIAKFLIKLVQRTCAEIKFFEIDRRNEVDIKKLKNRINVWEFLIKNVSIDFSEQSIDYQSFIRIFKEICHIVKAGSQSNINTLRLSNLYALLWFYMHSIWFVDCNNIFKIYHQDKALVIYLIIRLWGEFRLYGYDFGGEFYPHDLKLHVESLFYKRSLKLDPIINFLEKTDPQTHFKPFILPRKISSYKELRHLLECGNFQKSLNPSKLWYIKALAEIEIFVRRRCMKVKYLNLGE
jgi:hypothetical protein